MIRVDCRRCLNCTGEACKVYGHDANVAVKNCAEEGFENYVTDEKTDRKRGKEHGTELH